MSSKRVLVVDDEEMLARAIRNVLQAEGFEVEIASDGHEALRAFKSFRPDVMIMDVMMPKENGYRVSRMIKMLGPGAVGMRVPKIMLVTARNLGYDPEREEMLTQFSMADAVLYKPFKFKELLGKVRLWTE